MVKSWLGKTFLCPGSNDRGHIVFVLLSVCLSVVNFNLRYNFWAVRDGDFIFGMNTPLMMPFQKWPCDHDFDLEAKNSFFRLCSRRGHTVVFYKHPLIFHFVILAFFACLAAIMKEIKGNIFLANALF